jgi:hypothetical protein
MTALLVLADVMQVMTKMRAGKRCSPLRGHLRAIERRIE